VKKLPDSLNALLYLCFNVGPALVKAAVALSAAVGFFLVGVAVMRLGRDRRKRGRRPTDNGSVAADHGRGDDSPPDDLDDDDDLDGGDLDFYDGPIVKRQGPGPSCLLPLRVVPSVAVDCPRDRARGR